MLPGVDDDAPIAPKRTGAASRQDETWTTASDIASLTSSNRTVKRFLPCCRARPIRCRRAIRPAMLLASNHRCSSFAQPSANGQIVGDYRDVRSHDERVAPRWIASGGPAAGAGGLHGTPVRRVATRCAAIVFGESPIAACALAQRLHTEDARRRDRTETQGDCERRQPHGLGRHWAFWILVCE